MKRIAQKGSDRAAVIPRWPDFFDHQRGERVPVDLIGATIVAIGTTDVYGRDRPEGGGLVIDYMPRAGSDVRRIVLAFTEVGMWRHRIPSPDED
jgi:hypothetical protein